MKYDFTFRVPFFLLPVRIYSFTGTNRINSPYSDRTGIAACFLRFEGFHFFVGMTGLPRAILLASALPKQPCPIASGGFVFPSVLECKHSTPRKHKTRSYGCGLHIGRDDRIRTCDPVVPNDVRYRAALHPDLVTSIQK